MSKEHAQTKSQDSSSEMIMSKNMKAQDCSWKAENLTLSPSGGFWGWGRARVVETVSESERLARPKNFRWALASDFMKLT